MHQVVDDFSLCVISAKYTILKLTPGFSSNKQFFSFNIHHIHHQHRHLHHRTTLLNTNKQNQFLRISMSNNFLCTNNYVIPYSITSITQIIHALISFLNDNNYGKQIATSFVETDSQNSKKKLHAI